MSQHAYAQLSPIYMAMQTTINMKTSATNGDFCIRCHNPVGMNIGESLYVSNLKRNPTSREASPALPATASAGTTARSVADSRWKRGCVLAGLWPKGGES